ncbi:MAG: hypothetical protein Q9212_002410 [Teloschistes hypoglaucus]
MEFLLLFLSHLSLFTILTHAVTIEISPVPSAFISARCMSIRPGHCCNAIPLGSQNSGISRQNTRIKFTGLAPHDIASVWTDEAGRMGCNGRSIASFSGGTEWTYIVDDDGPIIRGGNYIKVPQGMPPTMAESQWMEGEGVLGLVTDYYGDWYPAQPAATGNLLHQLAGAALAAMGNIPEGLGSSGYPWKMRRRGKRVIDEGKMAMRPGGRVGKRDLRPGKGVGRGVVLCHQDPKRYQWPDVLDVHGVEYLAESPQSLVFTSQDGKKRPDAGKNPQLLGQTSSASAPYLANTSVPSNPTLWPRNAKCTLRAPISTTAARPNLRTSSSVKYASSSGGMGRLFTISSPQMQMRLICVR